MKPLNTLAAVAPATATDTLTKVASSFSGLVLETEADVENVIDKMGSGSFDLLLVDKNLSTEDYNKLNKMSDVLFPDAAVVNMVLQDEEFIRFKLSGLLAKWKDAQEEPTRKFFDNPDLGI